jgi:hypothetical protein
VIAMSAVVVPFPRQRPGDDAEAAVPLCSRYDGSWWFEPASFGKAIKICSRCPMRPRCLDDALRAGERLGVWGGLTPAQRAALPDAVVIPLRRRGRRR